MKKTNFLFIFLIFFSSINFTQVEITKVALDLTDPKLTIDKNIYGHFSEHLGNCIYGGLWVGENSKIPNTNGIRNDVASALKKIKIPILRWPGGCFADEYHWKDGIGPKGKRPTMINTNWGGVTEDNSFGTHEFLELCRQIECEPYFTANVGSGTVQELAQWVEYINSDNISPMTDLRKINGHEKSWGVKYWAIGNESWGCGGNMRPEYYADQLKRYGTYARNYGNNNLYKIACGPAGDDYNWTEVLMKNGGSDFSGLALHYYTWKNSKIATDITKEDWFDVMKQTLKMEELIEKHSDIMDKYDPNKRIALIVDEWGTWYKVEPNTNPGFLYQQNTLRDAVAAATNLNIFNNHCDRVKMANIAQIVNVLQSVILTKDDKMVLTPTYHVFDLYKVHQDATLVPVNIESKDYKFGDQKIPSVNASASIDVDNKVHLSLVNINPDASQTILCSIKGLKTKNITGQIITNKEMNAHNTFENPDVVFPTSFSNYKITGDGIEVTLPTKSVVMLELTGEVERKPALEIKDAKAGLSYKLYQGIWNQLPNFNLLNPEKSGVVENIILPESVPGENFGVAYSGYIKIPKEGLYRFYLASDDGSLLSVDGSALINNDGLHAVQEVMGAKYLSEGFHEIKIDFFQKGGGFDLNAYVEGPDLKKQTIPKEFLFH
jgi:alpha-N-arabinofuranosidase